jgi:phosphatidylserine/phosphatidylglycerophosphate/cardiolipin synthase-like enzyme
MKEVLQLGVTVFVKGEAEESALLVDACNYYSTLYRALEKAENYAVLCGWQFDSGVPLLRGDEAQGTKHPVTLLKFLNALCAEKPNLRIFLLAWDFSLVYALEREWMQGLKFAFSTNSRVKFEWDPHPVVGASHHQKFAVIDGVVGFTGGIDVCDARWDDCEHRADNPYRVNLEGDPCKPYHDVQAAVRGPIVQSMAELFVERWERASGQKLELPAPPAGVSDRFNLDELSKGCALPIAATHVALSRTQADPRAKPQRIREIMALFEAAIQSAERLIYAETQYFTSRSVAKVLIERMQDPTRSKLQIVVMMPRGADSPKEKLALGDTEEGVLGALIETAHQTGHELRVLYTARDGEGGVEIPTFIHSKVLIADDRILIVGSPNLTERSVGLDTELAMAWECETEADALHGCIRHVRAELMAEHAGCSADAFKSPAICATVDALMAQGDVRLRLRNVANPGPLGPIFAQIFDPGDPTLPGAVLPGAEASLQDDERDNWFARGIQELTQQLRKAVGPSVASGEERESLMETLESDEPRSSQVT